jgi:uncharacterized protein YyaL (SSP411 family)
MDAETNLLRFEASPYLLQHAENPVHWRPWGAAALAEAKRSNRPILLSIGYAACHWCHVMAHESFENEVVAALMNASFVPVKVDREERPDIDTLYMTALHALGEQGGWPLTMFLTPDGDPFWGGTYFPPTPRYGRPSFTQVLQSLAAAWAEGAEAIGINKTGLIGAIVASGASDTGSGIAEADLADAAHRLLSLLDTEQGGMKGAPKFPNPPIFRFLWQYALHHGASDARALEGRTAMHLLLRRMADGGIHDHLGGGFARYSTDGQWLAPHFEKMLYDNAQLLDLLALAEADRPDVAYREAAEGLVGWLFRDMGIADGEGDVAFAASEDADSEGEEGTFYVWQKAEIDALLGDDDALFDAVYDVTVDGNWERKTILRRRRMPHDQDESNRLAASRARLFAVRAQRPRPGRDDKILTDWNSLTIAALCRAAAVFAQPSWLEAAIGCHRFLRRHLGMEDGRLRHSWRDGRIGAAGLLDDQAAFAVGCLALFQSTADAAYLAEAETMVAVIDRWFGAEDGGAYTTAADADDLPAAFGRPRSAMDQAVPSGPGLFAEVLAKLFHLTGEIRYSDRAEALLRAFSGTPGRYSTMPSLLQASDSLDYGTAVVVSGPDADGLHAMALASGDPSLTVFRLRTDGHVAVSDSHPAASRLGQAPTAGASAFLCHRGVCGLPVTTPQGLIAALPAFGSTSVRAA